MFTRARRMSSAVATAAAVAVFTAACGGGGGDDANGEPAAAGGNGGGESTTLELEAKDFEFAPASLTAPAGAEVELTLKNTGVAPHTFTAESVSVDEQVEAGKSTTLSFTMPDSGTLAYVCKLHEAQGMVGSIEVA